MPAAVSEQSMRRVAFTALGGTSIEWYDFFLYGTAAALIFPTQFFAADMPPFVALLASFSTFAVGFLARPIGGVIFGHFGDRVGRKKTLVTALTLMGVATTLIGCLPTYATIGFWAPLLLILLRFAQGLAVGGQWGGAMLLVTESAPANKRGFYGAFAQAGAPVGLILANVAFLAVTAAVSPEALLEWGWRVPFLASVALIGLSMYVQLTLEDTPAFKELAANAAAATDTGGPVEPMTKSPVLIALTLYPKQIALAAGAFLSVQVTFYLMIAFVVSYGSSEMGLGLPKSTMLTAVLISSFAQIPGLFWFAHLTDRYGRRGIYMAGAILMGIWGFIMFPMIQTGEFLMITAALCIGQVILSMMYGPQAALLAELFSTHVRYSAASLGYQLGAIIGGGLAPLIAVAIWETTGGLFYVSVYVAIACALTWLSVFLLSDNHERGLSEV